MAAVDIKAAWRHYQSSQTGTPDISIGIAGSITAEPLVPWLGGYLLDRGLSADISIGPFNQLRQLCLDPAAYFGRDNLDVIVVLWRLEDMFGGMLAGCLDAPAENMEKLRGAVLEFAAAIAVLRSRFKGTLIVSTPPYPAMPGYAPLELGQAGSGMAVYHELLQLWLREMSRLERVRLLDLQALMLQQGMAAAHDARKWQLYRQPYAESFWHSIGRQAGRLIAAEKIPAKKCIVLDLDNTLWGGIIGEDGLEGLALGEEFPGRAYRDFQRQLMHLKSRGILLAVASRNNPDDALAVFDKHDAMVLSRKDIAAFEIHWQSKVESLQAIAKKLNIGLDALVFIDDNPKEIGEINERLPMVTTLLVPEELADLPALLDNTDLFDMAEITDEDRRRTEMIAANVERDSAQTAMSEEEFIQSLALEIDVFAVQKQHMARAAQLINKTNQFNLTTKRRTQGELEALVEDGTASVLGMNLRDKYGDYGFVGVAILQKQGATAVIDTLLMSCRVLGRGAEATFIAQIAAAAKKLCCTELQGSYIPTAKNDMVRELYARFNFMKDAATDSWRLPLAEAPKIPQGITARLTI